MWGVSIRLGTLLLPCLWLGSKAFNSFCGRGGVGIYFHPSSALHLQIHTDPLNWGDQSTLLIYYFSSYVPSYVRTSINESRPLPNPPQMSNGGSPPAHSSSSLDTPLDASYWLQCNWLQPPPRPPEWVIGWALRKVWPFECAACEYKQATGGVVHAWVGQNS